MSDYAAVVLAFTALMFFVFELAMRLETPEFGGRQFMAWMKMLLLGISLVMGLYIIGLAVEVMRLGGWGADRIYGALTWYTFWTYLIAGLLISLTVFYIFYLPRIAKELMQKTK